MIAYVYWPDEVSSIKSTCINIATLAGAVFGQLLFGFLADKNGRKMMYGIELALLIGSTVFVVMASTGVNNSMSIYAWLIWWRFVVGIGVGADYPLSAVITSEYDSLISFCILFIEADNTRHNQICSNQAQGANVGHCLLHATTRTDRK